MIELSETDLDDLATGTWIMGCGGGGNPYHGYLCAKKLYREGKRIRLIDPAQLADDALVACVNQMGAPLPGEERLSDPRTICKAVRLMEEYLGARFTAVMPWEIGGGNGFQPLFVAAGFDLPLVDADAMGRAFPEVQMVSMHVAGLHPDLIVLCDVVGNLVSIRATSGEWETMTIPTFFMVRCSQKFGSPRRRRRRSARLSVRPDPCARLSARRGRRPGRVSPSSKWCLRPLRARAGKRR